MTDSDFTEVNGWRWPADDQACRDVIFDEVHKLDVVLNFVTNYNAVIQAGGNCGVFAMALAKRFTNVYTFEPDPINFACLAHNVTAPNVIKLQAALGRGNEAPVSMHAPMPHNCGALQVAPGGSIPVLTIDALHLPSCGLIYLDIEGFEPMALQGAGATIQRCRPVIALEMKGIAALHGISDGQITAAIVRLGYQASMRVGKDTVFVPC